MYYAKSLQINISTEFFFPLKWRPHFFLKLKVFSLVRSDEAQPFSLSLSLIKTISILYIVINYVQYKIWKDKMYTIKKSMSQIGLCSCSKPILLENFRPHCMVILFSGLWFLSFGFILLLILTPLFTCL